MRTYSSRMMFQKEMKKTIANTKIQTKKDVHHQTESIGHNTLEHETFSMG